MKEDWITQLPEPAKRLKDLPPYLFAKIDRLKKIALEQAEMLSIWA